MDIKVGPLTVDTPMCFALISVSYSFAKVVSHENLQLKG
jgi:hypothetical protein